MAIHDFIIILNLIILEGLLSVDNAAVLAIMVKPLPLKDQTHALRWGLWGAMILRGACLVVANILLSFVWLKIVGGLYLVYLVYGHYTEQNDTIEEESDPKESRIVSFGRKIGLSPLWATILLVEIMDLAFSIDNVFAAVALSNKLWVIFTGVFIGIIAMRFVAGKFLDIMNKFPSLENSAFIVIAILGFKLILSGLSEYIGILSGLKALMEQHWFDLAFSSLMMVIFFFPMLKSKTKTKLGLT